MRSRVSGLVLEGPGGVTLMTISPNDFGASFKGFLDQVSAAVPPEESVFRKRLAEHFREPPDKLPTLTEKFPLYDHANLHIAVEAEFSGPTCSAEMVGVISPEYLGVTLSMLVAPAKTGLWGGAAPSEGPVEYINVELEDERVLACVQSGLCLATRGGEPLAVLMRGPRREYDPSIAIEVMARTREVAERLLADIRASMRSRSVHRGRVLSLDQTPNGAVEIKFHHLPAIPRESIILPDGLLERIERQTIRFSALTDRLLAFGRHLKRGILLYGAPGTGKTLTAMYVAQAIRGRTVLMLTGRGQRLIEPSCALARMLQPSIVILEDVDLVAEERTHQGSACATPLLFELLNEMDGLADDADVLFLLTTNRPEILEPALAARPGRVDQAFEIPLPDAACRRRLFDLYAAGLRLEGVNLDGYIQRTEGASAAFIRELLRKAALFAADEAYDRVEDRHLDEAVHELAVDGGFLTRRVLGFDSRRPISRQDG